MSRAKELEEFFETALEAFGRVQDSAQTRVQLGPLVLELHQSASLKEKGWSEPLAIRNPSGQEACATIYAWDDSLGSTKFPAPPWRDNYVYTHRGDIKGFKSERIEVAFNFDSRLLSMWDHQRRIGIYWTPNLQTLPSYEWAAPLRTLLHWLGLSQGLQLTHAGAVGRDGRGLLLAGKGGSGKSTTSLACLHAGWDYVSDDYCWVGFTPRPTAYPVYKTAKLIPGQGIDLPRWERSENLSHEKDVFFVEDVACDGLVSSLTLEALLLPRPAEVQQTGLRPAERRDSLAALSLSTVAQLAGAGPKSMSILNRLVDDLRCYHLDLCHPVTAVPTVMESALTS